VRLDILFHRSSSRSSFQTSLVHPPLCSSHTISLGKVRSHSFAPSREALRTPVSRQAPTNPLCSATRNHISGSAATREAAETSSLAECVVGDVGGGADGKSAHDVVRHKKCAAILSISRGMKKKIISQPATTITNNRHAKAARSRTTCAAAQSAFATRVLNAAAKKRCQPVDKSVLCARVPSIC
jgi:hypothetical protein